MTDRDEIFYLEKRIKLFGSDTDENHLELRYLLLVIARLLEAALPKDKSDDI